MVRTFPENAGRFYAESCPLRFGSDGERLLKLRLPPSRRSDVMGATRAAEIAVAVRSCVASLVPPGNMASRWLFVQKAATNELMPAPFDEAERPQARLPHLAPLPADTLGGGPMAVAWAWATLPRRGGAAGGFDIYIKCEVRDPLSTT